MCFKLSSKYGVCTNLQARSCQPAQSSVCQPPTSTLALDELNN
jgi:hypothetical protein